MLLFRDFGLLHTDKLHILRETDQLGTLAKMIAINAFLQHGKKMKKVLVTTAHIAEQHLNVIRKADLTLVGHTEKARADGQ
jgi:hypothetical protein